MKKNIFIFTLLLWTITLLFGCSQNQNDATTGNNTENGTASETAVIDYDIAADVKMSLFIATL